MGSLKTNLMVEVLEKLKFYTVKSVKVENMIGNSDPSEDAKTTYENLKKHIPTLEKSVSYKILSVLLNRTINDETLISKHDITMLVTGNHNDNNSFNIYKRIEILKMLDLVSKL